jgi:hypothetical protein
MEMTIDKLKLGIYNDMILTRVAIYMAETGIIDITYKELKSILKDCQGDFK